MLRLVLNMYKSCDGIESMQDRIKRILILIVFLCVAMMTPSIVWVSAAGIEISWEHIGSVRDEFAHQLTWSPDSRFIASLNSEADRLSILEVATQEIVRSFSLPSIPNSAFRAQLKWSPNGRYILTNLRGKTMIVDAETGLQVGEDIATDTAIVGVEWSNNSRLIALFSNIGTISIYNLETQQVERTIDLVVDPTKPFAFYNVFAWSPNNELFAAPFDDGSDSTTVAIGVWDMKGNLLTDFSRTNCANYILFANTLRDSDALRWASDNGRLVWTAVSMAVCEFNESNMDLNVTESILYQTNQPGSDLSIFQPIYLADWSPNGNWIVASANMDSCEVRLFDTLRNLEAIDRFPTVCGSEALAWSPDGSYIAALSDSGLWLGRVNI